MIRVLFALPGLVPRVRVRVAVAVGLALAQSATLLPIALVVRQLFDRDVPHHRSLQIVAAGALIAVCYAASAVAAVATRSYAARVTKEAVGELRRDLMARLCRLPMTWHDRNAAGTVHAVVIQDCERVDRMVIALMSVVLPALMTGIGLAAVAAVLSPLLSGVLALALPVMVVAARRFAGRFRERLEHWHATAEAFSSHAHLLLGGIATIRAAGLDDHESERFSQEIDGFVGAGYRAAVAGSRYAALQGAIASVTGVAVLVTGGILVARRDMSVGALIAFYAVVALILRQVSAALSAAPVVMEGSVAVDRVTGLLAAAEPDPYRGRGEVELAGRIELRRVTFGYGERPALRGVDLVVEPGEQVAVIGANGAGKSTLLAVLLGLYRPQSGSVLLDGIELADLDLPAVRRQIGVVLQDAALFPGTIAQNIAMGRSGLSAESVRDALRVADATEFIDALPDGLETSLMDGGVGLSGGQRQRLALARALVGRPRLLLLDEPTANLHWEVSERVMANLRELPWRPTVVVITHDPSVAARADRVRRLDRGCLVDDRTPELKASVSEAVAISSTGPALALTRGERPV